MTDIKTLKLIREKSLKLKLKGWRLGQRVFFDGGENEKGPGWRKNFYGTIASYNHPLYDVLMVQPDGETYKIPMYIYELKKI
jgi:hypothetical protein